jgi:hypothetical protein
VIFEDQLAKICKAQTQYVCTNKECLHLDIEHYNPSFSGNARGCRYPTPGGRAQEPGVIYCNCTRLELPDGATGRAFNSAYERKP